MFQTNIIQNLWIEIAYSLIISLICFIIYFRTKKISEVISYNGIKYFRYAFLFFGISFVSRLGIPLYKVLLDGQIFLFLAVPVFITIFTGTMALFLLLYSLLWKKFEKVPFNPLYLLSSFALIISALIFLIKSRALIIIILIIQMILFLIVAIISFLNHRDSKKEPKNFFVHFIYILLFFSWIIHLFAFFALHLSLIISVILYIMSTMLFLTILHRVVKKTKE